MCDIKHLHKSGIRQEGYTIRLKSAGFQYVNREILFILFLNSLIKGGKYVRNNMDKRGNYDFAIII